MLNGKRYSFDVELERRSGSIKIVGISNIDIFLQKKNKKDAELLQIEKQLNLAKNDNDCEYLVFTVRIKFAMEVQEH
ncbi:hypothetical protein SPSIL_038470 [Sporomusa silvacetica DSM 10669]|uniref:Uncharacterized protein n=1 Tax=Sporomusa silvacetica DSM 10669 TaxID=1123289 RepID=A0ABZ3IQ90_9FIRM|nr:hypothetical protein [Sporomusa silvacetica]OZC14098.1 hypothetical protein SPSIL_50390 [Sporomusa silvacetica DSM 10669]